jgi:Zn-dependent peptidase ImmA (M78 family)/transcriptional regulator with XRE-family HTH domain
MKTLPINPAVLKWARETRGLSTEEVADKLGRKSISADTIAVWETGVESPNYIQLETLAYKVYNRPLAVFFFPFVPKEETTRTEFRTLPDTVIDDLSPGMVKLYRKAKLYQLYLEELCEGKRPSNYSLLDDFSLNEHCKLIPVVKDIRKALGISIEEQSTWHSAETAAKKWREAFESCGIFVFKDAFRNDEYSGFCLYNMNYPMIFVNNSMPASRQLFTLFHELAHLLYGSGGVDFRSGDPVRSFQGYYLDVEVCCNRFANECLVPRQVFDSMPKEISEEHFQKCADYFSVSREVILRNYLDRGLIDISYYDQMSAKWIKQAKTSRNASGGGNYYYNIRTYLGERYINLVYSQYYQNKITVDNVAEYLNVKAKNLSTIEHLVLEGGKL